MSSTVCGLRLQLRLDTDPVLVSVTRRFIEEALRRFVTDRDLVSRVAMTAHELLENAAKYARDRNAELSVTLDSAGGKSQVVLRLCNDTTPLHIERLRQIFSELDACRDPLALYVDLMRRNARRPDVSGLGLARIVAEGEMTLGLSVDGRTATIVARTPVGGMPP
jgi:hypothetical protein